MRKHGFLLFFSLGFFSLLSQTLILREFIISFGGNELGIGLFYFFWLLWVGIGALFSLTFLRNFLSKHFFKYLFFYPLLSFLEILLFITLKRWAQVRWWEFFSLERVFLYLFLFTSFISFFTGVIFTVGILWFKKEKKIDNTGIVSSLYIAESLGSFFSGGLVTFLIVKLLPPLIILILGSIIFSFVSLWVSARFKERIGFFLNIILIALLLFLLTYYRKVDTFSLYLRLKNSFPAAEEPKEVYTPYQHLLLGKLGSRLIVFSNGEIITTVPELIDADRESALFVTMANMPNSVLVFGYGVENLLRSLLKFPVENITYCLEDKVYYDVVTENIPQGMKESLEDPRLKVVFKSPRLFLKENKDKFDLVIIYTPDPSNLVINTFFTQEFYTLVKSNLTDKGVIATRITSAENYIGEEIKNYGSSLYYTLKEVFPKIVIIPGKINWFLVGDNGSFLTESAAVLEERFKRFIPAQFSFSPQGFRSLMRKERMRFIRNMYVNNPLFKKGKLRNQDIQPLTFFLNLLVMARYSNSYLVKFLKSAVFVGIYIFIIPILLAYLARLHFLLRIENIRVRRLLFNSKLFQFFSGFLGFAYHLTLIFLFQNRFGVIFQLIGLVNSLFMLGLGGGGFLGKFLVQRTSLRNDKVFSIKIIIGVLIAQGILIFSGYLLFIKLHLIQQFVFFLFLLFFLLSGVLTGSSYPLSAKVLEDSGNSLITTAANVELLDHWGGALAGLLVGVFMLPLLGVFKTLFLLILIILLLIILFVMEMIPLRFIQQERTPFRLFFPYIRTSYILVIVSLTFIIDSYIIEKKANILGEKSPVLLRMVKDGCQWQNTPFPAYVCVEKGKKEFILETKDFASHIKGMFGPINLVVRIDSKGEIQEIKVAAHRETPSYVGNLDVFLKQFKGLSLRKNIFLNKDVNAITGATVTSQAIVDIVNETARKIRSLLEKEDTEVSYETGVDKRQKIIFDSRSLYLIGFVILAILLYIFSPNHLIRRIYLFLVVVILGVFLNLTFSFFHLGNLITFNIGGNKFFSQIIIYLLPIILGLFLGQFWCGWLCPWGALQEIVHLPWSKTKFAEKWLNVSAQADKKARYFKYVFLTIFIVVIAVRREASIFRQEPLTSFFLNPTKIGEDKLLSIVIILFSLFFLRFWCRYFCVCGAFLSFFNKIRLLRKFFFKKYKRCPLGVADSYDMDCIQCNLCVIEDKDKRKIEIGKDKFFKLSFFSIVFLMVVVFTSNINIKHRSLSFFYKDKEGGIVFEKVDVDKIKKLIAEGKLSDRESLFYKIIEDKSSVSGIQP